MVGDNDRVVIPKGSPVSGRGGCVASARALQGQLDSGVAADVSDVERHALCAGHAAI